MDKDQLKRGFYRQISTHLFYIICYTIYKGVDISERSILKISTNNKRTKHQNRGRIQKIITQLLNTKCRKFKVYNTKEKI